MHFAVLSACSTADHVGWYICSRDANRISPCTVVTASDSFVVWDDDRYIREDGVCRVMLLLIHISDT